MSELHAEQVELVQSLDGALVARVTSLYTTEGLWYGKSRYT